MSGNSEKFTGMGTLCVQGAGPHDWNQGAVTTPIYHSSTFKFEDTGTLRRFLAGELDAYVYSRYANPTVRAVEKHLAALEGAETALLYSSGMGALSAMALGLLSQGDEIISIQDIYGGTARLYTELLPRFGIHTRFVSSLDEVPAAVGPKTRILFVETPTNPLLGLHSLSKMVKLAKEHGLTSVIDNTFSTPCIQRPIEWGVDICVHSATKYLGGHSDLIAGVVMGRKDMLEPIEKARRVVGSSLDPTSAWLIERGLRTLALRMERHNANALEVARFLEGHPAVERVHYPGLASHPDHALACEQMKGFGGMVAFEVKGDPDAVLNRFKLFTLAVSLGGVESLVCQPVNATHYGLDKAILDAMGISERSIRLSVGIEDAADLIADLKQALG